MNAPYLPPPGQPYPPGYPPPPRQGMGCFAKGCLAIALVLLALGIMAGIVGWFFYNAVRPFVGTAPVAVRTFPATAAQYSALLDRVRTFETELANGRSATLAFSADELNTFIARSPLYEGARGRFYFSMVDNLLVIDASFPVSGEKQGGGSGTTYYFSGKVFCEMAYTDHEFDITVRKLETIDGEPASGIVKAMVDKPEFSRGFNRSFNDALRNATRTNPDAAAFLAKLHGIAVQDNRLVFTGEP